MIDAARAGAFTSGGMGRTEGELREQRGHSQRELAFVTCKLHPSGKPKRPLENAFVERIFLEIHLSARRILSHTVRRTWGRHRTHTMGSCAHGRTVSVVAARPPRDVLVSTAVVCAAE